MKLIKRISKIVATIIVLLLLVFVAFFMWASSPNYSDEDYIHLIESLHLKSTDDDSTYSIVSYNIGYLSGMTNNLPLPSNKSLFDKNLKTVCDEINNIDADILCFQEIDFHSNRSYYVNQQQEIQELGYNYAYQAINWDVNYLPFPGKDISFHYGEMFSGQSIVSKYPMKNPKRIVLERVEDIPFYRDAFYLDRLAQVSNITLDGRQVVLINVHLEAYDSATRVKQTNYVAGLYNKYKDNFPVLLVGDFNDDVSQEGGSISVLLDIPGIAFADTDREENENTYPSTQATKRIDYIFYNEAYIDLIDSKVLTSFGQASDHLPVWMEFRLK